MSEASARPDHQLDTGRNVRFRDPQRLVRQFYGESSEGDGLRVDPQGLRNEGKTWAEVEEAMGRSEAFHKRVTDIAHNTSPIDALRDIYHALFNRETDNEGMGVYKDQIEGGRPVPDVIQEVLRSGEYSERAVRLLYKELLLREPDPQGRDIYKNQLIEGRTISSVADELRNSTERKVAAMRRQQQAVADTRRADRHSQR